MVALSEPITEEQTVQLEKQRVLRRHAVLLAALAQAPAFKFLFDEVRKKQSRMKDTLAARLYAGEDIVVLQRQIDYDRGYIDGMMYPKAIVDGAVNTVGGIVEEETAEPKEAVTDGWPGYEQDRS